ncbi:hypothetical protein KI387_000243, partial [Taxus chinensis]
ERETTPNPKEEEFFLAVEEKNVDPKASNIKQVIEEPSILPSTSSPSSSNVGEEFDISNSMLEDDGNHGEQVANHEDTMEEVEHLQQDNNEAIYLSDLEDYFDGEEPVEIP